MSEIGREYDVPGVGRFRVIGIDAQGNKQAEYLGQPSQPKPVRGWTPKAPSKPPVAATVRLPAIPRPRKAGSRPRRRTYRRASYARYAPRPLPTAKPKKKDDPAVWVGGGIILLAFCLIGSCQQIQNRRLPDFVTGHHGR